MVATYPFDVADHLKTQEEINMFIEEVIELAKDDADPNILVHCLETAARAQGMLEISKKTGLDRSGLYRSLGKKRNPTLATFGKVANALGYRISLVKIDGKKLDSSVVS